MKATVRLREIKRPVSEETIGFRLQAAVPNNEGFKGMTSYKKPFLIVESSDYAPSDIEGNFLKILSDFEKKLNWQGYTDLHFSQK